MATVGHHPLTLNPLAPPQSPLSAQETARANPSVASAPSSSADSLRLLIASPSKLRETIILNELLQPPLALRRTRGGR